MARYEDTRDALEQRWAEHWPMAVQAGIDEAHATIYRAHFERNGDVADRVLTLPDPTGLSRIGASQPGDPGPARDAGLRALERLLATPAACGAPASNPRGGTREGPANHGVLGFRRGSRLPTAVNRRGPVKGTA